jgi:hypothetical protein
MAIMALVYGIERHSVKGKRLMRLSIINWFRVERAIVEAKKQDKWASRMTR